jgi:hypothetical protein
MPTAPMLPPEMMARSGAASPVNPANFLMAAADMSKSGSLPDAARGRSIPAGINKPLQTGKPMGRRAKLQVLK